MTASFEGAYPPVDLVGVLLDPLEAGGEAVRGHEGHPFGEIGRPADARGRRDAGDGAPRGHERHHLLGQVADGQEVHGHHVDVGELTAGPSRAVKERVDLAADRLDGSCDGVGVPQVGVVVTGHLHRGLLQVDDMDLGALARQLGDRSRPHATAATAGDDHSSSFIVPDRRHGDLSPSLAGFRHCGPDEALMLSYP
jgi:hypothetical protein